MHNLGRCYFLLLIFTIYLTYNIAIANSCPGIGLEENYEIKKRKVEKCFIKDHKLKHEVSALIDASKVENYNESALKALMIANYLFNLSNDKTKYATSNFPFISSHFFYKLAKEYFLEYYERDLQSESLVEFSKWPNVIRANIGLLETVKKMSWKEVDVIAAAVTYFVEGIGSLEASLILVLEQTKINGDIAKPDNYPY
jgi:hypothetical protein